MKNIIDSFFYKPDSIEYIIKSFLKNDDSILKAIKARNKAIISVVISPFDEKEDSIDLLPLRKMNQGGQVNNIQEREKALDKFKELKKKLDEEHEQFNSSSIELSPTKLITPISKLSLSSNLDNEMDPIDKDLFTVNLEGEISFTE